MNVGVKKDSWELWRLKWYLGWWEEDRYKSILDPSRSIRSQSEEIGVHEAEKAAAPGARLPKHKAAVSQAVHG